MALFEHDIEFGKITKQQSKKANATDTFSGSLLKQFGKGGFGGKELGTLANFMKSDLRIQASTNQFTQKGFKLNKQSLTMASKYYKLDKKVRAEERDYYKKANELRKAQKRKDRVEAKWRKEILKALGGVANNTDTLRRERRIQTAGSILTVGQKGGQALSSGLMRTLSALATGRNTVEAKIDKSNKSWNAQHNIQKTQRNILRGIDSGIGLLVKVTKKSHEIQERGNAKRNARQRDRTRILESQGIGPRQTREDARELKEREEQAKSEAKKIGGFGSTYEEKEARKRLQQEARELRVLRKRGFTGDDISNAFDSGVSRRELVESGRTRRRTGAFLGRAGRGSKRFAKRGGKFLAAGGRGLAKVAPMLGMVAAAGVAVNQVKSGNIKEAIGSFAKEIPFVQQMQEQFDVVSGLIPKGVKDSITKYGSKIFDRIWTKLSSQQGGKSSKITELLNAVTRFLDIIGGAVTKFGKVLMNTILSGPVIQTFTSTGKFIIELGKNIIGGLTGVINFLTDIFGESKKAFGPAFMEHIWPHIKDFSLKVVPAFFDMMGNVIELVKKAIKGLIIGFVGPKIAGWFGIKGEPSNLTKASQHIVAGRDQIHQARVELLQQKFGQQVLSLYVKSGLDSAMSFITEKERKGDLKREEAEKLRTTLSKMTSGQSKINKGVEIRKGIRAKKAKDSAKNIKSSTEHTPTTSSASNASLVNPVSQSHSLLEGKINLIPKGSAVIGNMVSSVKSVVTNAASSGGNILDSVGVAASSILSSGVTGLASLPNSVMDRMSGTKAGVMMMAMKGAMESASAEVERVGMAMNRALGEDPTLSKISNSTSEMRGYTQEIANREDKNRNSFLEGTNPLEKLYEQQHAPA